MNIIAETRENIENWLDRKQRKAYKRMKGDNYQGYVYQLMLPDPNMDCAAVIRLTDLNMLVFEMYSGIRVLDPVLMAPVALYCQQRVKTGFGGVIAEELSGCITYRAETVFRENAVSEETLELYEEEAIHTISTHYENLKALASGKFLSLEEPVEIAYTAEKKVDKATATEAIRTYLESENHNIKAENLNAEDPNGFLCEIRVGGKHLMINYAVSDGGILTLTGYYGTMQMPVKKEYRYAVAEYLNSQNSNNLYGMLCVGTEHTGWSYSVSTSLLDEPVSERVISNMERILIHGIMDSATVTDRLSAGLLVSAGRQERDLKQQLEMLSSKLLGNVLGDLPFEGDTDNEEEITEEDIDVEENDANDNDTEDDVTMDDWLKQLALPDPAPEAV
mgnify:FL=1